MVGGELGTLGNKEQCIEDLDGKTWRTECIWKTRDFIKIYLKAIRWARVEWGVEAQGKNHGDNDMSGSGKWGYCLSRWQKYYLLTYLHTYLLTYLLTQWCRVLLEKLTGLQLVKKFPVFHGTRRFITALTSVRHLSLSRISPIQSIYPHPTSWRSILILSTHLRLGLPSGLLPSGFPSKTLYTPLSSPIHATCPAHLILLDFITRIILGEGYK